MDDDDFQDPPDVRWTGPARAALIAAAERLADAVRSHADTLTALEGREADIHTVFDASRQLAEAAVVYADAQIDLTHTGWPLVLIEVESSLSRSKPTTSRRTTTMTTTTATTWRSRS